jgi:hypothetical protein
MQKPPLVTTHPELASEAYGWDPAEVTFGSNKQLPWKCNQGHIWSRSPNSRTQSKMTGCPFCNRIEVIVGENDFETEYPDLAKEAYGWNPSEYFSGSGKRMKWKCPKGHIWDCEIYRRHSGKYPSNCIICSGRKILVGYNDLATTHPELAAEAFGWDPTKVSKGSVKKQKWKCPAGHIFETSPNTRTNNNSGCAYCRNLKALPGFNDLATTHPEIAVEAFGWDPTQVMHGSVKPLKWKCSLGHVFENTPNSRTNTSGRKQGQNCQFCSGHQILKGFNDLTTKRPDVAIEAYGWDPKNFTEFSSVSKPWMCSAGHKWTCSIANRTNNNSKCPTCTKGSYDPNGDGYLYLIHHPLWNLLKVGISNFQQKRTLAHKARGWEILEIHGPMDGLLALEWEKSILKMIAQNGADLGRTDIAGKFDGYTEAWIADSLRTNSLKELMKMVQENEV